MPCGRACVSSIWQVTDMKVWHVLKQGWHWLWQGRFPVAAILFLLLLAFTLALYALCCPTGGPADQR